MDKSSYAVTHRERELVFRIADGSKPILYKIYELRIICERAKGLPYEDILAWLAMNNLTGLAFIDYLVNKNENSILVLAKRVRAKLLRDVQLRPVFGRYKI